MNPTNRTIPQLFCIALLTATTSGCLTEQDLPASQTDDHRTLPAPTGDTIDREPVRGTIDQFGPEQVAAPMERELVTLDLTKEEFDAVAEKIISITPAYLGPRFDYASFLDLDLGGIMTTDAQNLNACRQSNYNEELSLLTIQYNCENLDTISAPNGSISCYFSDDHVGPHKRPVKLVSCNFNFATQMGEIAGNIRSNYSRDYNRLMAVVTSSVYTLDQEFDIDTVTEYAVDHLRSDCSAYNGYAVVHGASNGQTYTAEFAELTRCADSCRATSGHIDFEAAADAATPPFSVDTLTYVGSDNSWEHEDPSGTKALYTVCN